MPGAHRTLRWAGAAAARCSIVLTMICLLGLATTGVALAGNFSPARNSPFVVGQDPGPVVFSPDGKLLAVGEHADHVGPVIHVFNVSDQGDVREVPGSPFKCNGLSSLAFGPDGKLLAAGHVLGVTTFAVQMDGSLRQVAVTPPRPGGGFSSLAFSPDGKLLAGGGAFSHKVHMWSVSANGTLRDVPGSPFSAGSSSLSSVTFSPNGSLLAASGFNEPIRVYAVQADGSLRALEAHPSSAVMAIAFSPVQSVLIAASSQIRGVSAFSVTADGQLTELSGSPFSGPQDAHGLAVSASGAWVATPDYFGGTVSVFSSQPDGTLKYVEQLAVGKQPRPLAFSSDGRLLAVANTGDEKLSMFVRGPGARPSVERSIALRDSASRSTLGAGRRVAFTLRVTNLSWRTLHHVRACQTLPRGLAAVGTSPGSRRSGRRYCWTARRLGFGRHAAYRLTVRVSSRARGRLTSRASAKASGTGTVRAQATVRISRPGGAG